MSWLELLPLILKMFGYFLDRSNASNTVKQQYYTFLQSLIDDEASSAKLRDSAMSQRDRILAKISNGQ